jgi:hypothetical protein
MGICQVGIAKVVTQTHVKYVGVIWLFFLFSTLLIDFNKIYVSRGGHSIVKLNNHVQALYM